MSQYRIISICQRTINIFNCAQVVTSLITKQETIKKNLYLFQYQSHTNNMDSEYTFFYEQSIFDPCSEYCLSFSKKPPQKIVYQLFSRWSINFYCLNIQTF